MSKELKRSYCICEYVSSQKLESSTYIEGRCDWIYLENITYQFSLMQKFMGFSPPAYSFLTFSTLVKDSESQRCKGCMDRMTCPFPPRGSWLDLVFGKGSTDNT